MGRLSDPDMEATQQVSHIKSLPLGCDMRLILQQRGSALGRVMWGLLPRASIPVLVELVQSVQEKAFEILIARSCFSTSSHGMTYCALLLRPRQNVSMATLIRQEKVRQVST
jgi:hypothetical protein